METEKGNTIQFNLNKFNDDLYPTILKEHKIENEAKFFRSLFFKYINNPRYIREEILYTDIFSTINAGIEQNKKVNIKYRGEIRSINPYFIKISPAEDRMYLFGFCEKHKEFRNYRISNIESVSISKNDREIIDREYIKNIDKFFDPFLSYGKRVVIKITPAGEKLFKIATANRPNVIEKNKNIWTLECTNRLAKIYFPQFLSEVEILEPLELREWFVKELRKACEMYEEGKNE